MRNSKETKKKEVLFGGVNVKKYLHEIYENDEEIQSLILFNDFVNLVVEKCTSKNELLKMRTYEFQDMVIHETYGKNSYSQDGCNEDVEYNLRKLSFNDNF